MTKKPTNRLAEKEREISAEWYARPIELRTTKHIEDFADDMRGAGLSLRSDSTQHISAVRILLRIF